MYNVIHEADTKEVNIMAQINLRIDDEIKRKAEKACEAMGMNLTTAITIYMVKLGNEMRIPFEVSADPFCDEDHMKTLEKRAADAKAGRKMHEHELIG